jgi:hypothetical protein
MGCKFKHEKSKFCTFGRYCKTTLCQYNHKKDKTNDFDKEEKNSEEEVNSNDEANELTVALEKVKTLENVNIDMEKRLKLYSAAIKKMRDERRT